MFLLSCSSSYNIYIPPLVFFFPIEFDKIALIRIIILLCLITRRSKIQCYQWRIAKTAFVLVLVRLRSIPVSAMGEMLLSYLTSRGDSESGSVGGRSVPGNIEIMVHSPSNLLCHHAPLEQGRDCSEAETGICQEQVRRPWEEQEVAMLMAHLPLLSQQHVDWPSGQSHQHERPSVPEQR